MKTITFIFFLITTGNISFSQHIEYRDKKKPSIITSTVTAEPDDTIAKGKKKKFIEEQNMCNLLSGPKVSPKLPLILNSVSPEMIKILKGKYAGRLYSITALNMIDKRLKYKLKICDKDNAKFRSEYLDKDGNIVTDPDLDYE